MASEAVYLLNVLPLLPPDLAKRVRSILEVPDVETTLDNLIRFVSGAPYHSATTSVDDQAEWAQRQDQAAKRLGELSQPNCWSSKRPRDDPTDSDVELKTKRPRLLPEVSSSSSSGDVMPVNGDTPIFTLHSVSTTSPIRKKVDITVTTSSIRFTNPSTQAVEASVPRSLLKRAFLLPTRGKSKPHWSVVLISSDTPDRGKATNASVQSNPQIIFGLDATPTTPFTTTVYNTLGEPNAQVHPKGSMSTPFLRDFLAKLGIQVLEPSAEIFKSACNPPGSGSVGVPGVEAYRAAKVGTLWFMPEGILWGESKPCEFWAVEDLIGKSEGLRMISATGRTCTVIITRKSAALEEPTADDDGEDVGVETEFGMVDAREQDGINQWARQHRHLFGRQKVAEVVGQNGAPAAGGQAADDSDEDDEDFEADSDDDGSPTESSDDEGSDGSDDSTAAEGSDAEDDAEGDDDNMSDEEELKEENHPLMKPGAMPRMSRAAINMAVAMVEQDLAGAAGGSDDDEEEDELED